MRNRYIILAAIGALWAGGVAGGGVNVTGIANTCNNCHGAAGISVGKAMPTIGGQTAGYLKMVLDQYKTGERRNTSMGRLVKGYTDAELAALADYFSRQKWVSAGEKADPKLIAKGRALHEKKKCLTCHGAKGEVADDSVPRIGGQWAEFFKLEMEKYQYPELPMPDKVMARAVKGLSAEDLDALAAFYAGQK
jgi:sulfide dehydrogenase cytochrome subunit